MKALLVGMILFVLHGLHTVQAQLPDPVAQGLHAVEAGDYDRAIDEWTKAWRPSAATDSARTRLKTSLANLADRPSGWELIRDEAIAKTVHRYYVVVFAERDPLYLVLEAYHRPDGVWTVEYIVFNTSLNKLPPLDVAQFAREP